MVTENNSYINSFSGGMNSDTSVTSLSNTQYIESRNIRISTYSNHDDTTTNKQQQLLPIEGLKVAADIAGIEDSEILASTNVRDYGIIIYKEEDSYKNSYLGIIRFKNINETEFIENVHRYNLFYIKDPKWKDVHKVSVTTRYEDEDIIKLYIADGVNPILVFNIAPSNEKYIDVNNDIDKYKSYPKVLFSRPTFKGYISGNMKTSIVSYSYQLYNKNGISTDVSPACKFIPVGNGLTSGNYNNISGGHKGDYTGCGCSIKISNDTYSEFLNKIIVYRISYEENGQMPTISVIYDGEFQAELTIKDTGQQSLRDISIEEYNSMSGIYIIPKVIENKNDYLFAANVKQVQSSVDDDEFKNWDSRAFCFDSNSRARLYDSQLDQYVDIYPNDLNTLPLPDDPNASQPIVDSCQKSSNVNEDYQIEYSFDKTGKYFGGSGLNVEWRFIITQKIGDASVRSDNGLEAGTVWNILNKTNPNANIDDKSKIQNGVKTYFVKYEGGHNSYEEAKGLYTSNDDGIWKNPYLIRSLRRDELYRYGIILYDKYGQPSPVKWIADIRTPDIGTHCFETFVQNGTIDGVKYECVLKVLGIAFKVSNLPEQCTGYEIVRCDRGFDDIATISQGITAKSIQQAYCNTQSQKYTTYSSPFYFTTGNDIEGYDYDKPFTDPGNNSQAISTANNFSNHSVIQFASPEICYQSENFKTLLNKYDYKLCPQLFMYGRRGDSKFTNDLYDDMVPMNGPAQYGTKYIFPAVSNSGAFVYRGNGKTRFKNAAACMDSPYMKDLNFRASLHYGAYRYKAIYQISSYYHSMYQTPIPNSSVYQWDKLYGNNYSAYLKGYYARKTLQETGNCFTYIKPYTSTIAVLHFENDNPGQPISTFDQSLNERIDVNNIKIAENVSWDDIENQKYTNKVTVVGNEQYCNVVANGFFGRRPQEGENPESDVVNGSCGILKSNSGSDSVPTSHVASFVAGPAGKCAILNIDKNNKLTNSIASQNYFVANSNNELQLQRSGKLLDFNINDYVTCDMHSLLGTHLCNLRKTTNPYGGQGSVSRNNSVYYSDGDYFNDKDQWVSVFDGDTNVEMFEYVHLHKYYANNHYDDHDHVRFTNQIIYCIPVESSIRFPFTNGVEPYKNLVNTNDRSSWSQENPSNVNDIYTQSNPLYTYNTVYSTENRLKSNYQYSYEDSSLYNKTVDFRCMHSSKKENHENIDNWTKFQSSNFIDVNSNYGEITGLRSFKNLLVFWQQHATGLLSVNERAITTDESNGTSLILGEGGVLSRYDYIDTTTGMHKNQFCDTMSNSTLYWFDYDNNEIKSYSEGLVQLSKQLFVDGLLYKYQSNNTKPTLAYDIKNNEILFNVASVDNVNSSIVFNEQGKVFTSIYTIGNDDFVNFSNCQYVVRAYDNRIAIAKWNCFDDDHPDFYPGPHGYDGILKSYIKYAVNKNPIVTKVFDNQEIVSPSLISNREDSETYFSLNHNYSWKTDLIETDDTLTDQITLREGNYRFAIPRAKSDQQFGLRMRGKYMICEIENSNPKMDIGIQYIITKFRQSWI